MPISAQRCCSRLLDRLRQGPRSGRVLSLFLRAVNIESGSAILTLLPSGARLHPFSCDTEGLFAFDGLGLSRGDEVLLEDCGIVFPRTGRVVSLSQSEAVELSLSAQSGLFVPRDLSERLWLLRRSIEVCKRTEGMSPLVTGGAVNPYCELVRPRLEKLRLAIGAGDAAACEAAAARLAGCGVGLTPASDDLLCGYFMGCLALEQALHTGAAKALTLTKRAAAAAAPHTTRLSAAFLLQSGEGLFSEELLELARCVFSDVAHARLVQSAKRLAAYGSTSGADTLTGVYLAITEQYGGMKLD